jgi:hypothetical protein
MAKSTISVASFNSELWKFTRGYMVYAKPPLDILSHDIPLLCVYSYVIRIPMMKNSWWIALSMVMWKPRILRSLYMCYLFISGCFQKRGSTRHHGFYTKISSNLDGSYMTGDGSKLWNYYMTGGINIHKCQLCTIWVLLGWGFDS